MAVRTDISVDATVSPRIATVAAPSTSVTIQDLHDTLRFLESRPWFMSHKSFLSSAGKDDLGGGTRVGITLRLENTLLAFAARVGPSFTICTVSGGNLVAVDDAGASLASPIHPTAFVQVVLAQSSSATISGIAQVETDVSAIKVKTDNLPASPASETTVAAALSASLRTSGLLHENAVIDQQTWEGTALKSARLRCYNSKANAQAGGAAGLWYEYTIAAEYADGKLSRYSIVRET